MTKPFDLSAHLGCMTRAVRSTTHEGKPAKALVAARVFPTDPEDLWEALTTPARLRRWFLPVTGELRLGGRYQLEGNASGTITTCEPPRRLAVTWEFGGETSWVTVTLSPEGGQTRLDLEHVADATTPKAAELWAQFGPGAMGVGWDLGLMGLARHLADPSLEQPPEASQDWLVSDEAKQLYRTTSVAWAEAAIADGEPEVDARSAAERTRAFYAGEA
jgi:uncharacterized protein YndB with AHSA1/START domain